MLKRRSLHLPYTPAGGGKLGKLALEAADESGTVAAVGLGYTIFQDIANNKGDIRWNLASMDGAKHPWDDQSYANRGAWNRNALNVKGKITVAFVDELSATFRVEYWYNGHSVGYVDISPIDTNDAPFWAINVTARIKKDPNTYQRPMAAIFVKFTFEFEHSIRDSRFFHRRYHLFGDGRARRSSWWSN